MKRPRCSVCSKPCDVTDRNSDGTYTCDECLYTYSVHPTGRGEKGGNLYGVATPERKT